MDSFMSEILEPSKFKKNSECLLQFIKSPKCDNLIYKHQKEALLAVKNYFDCATDVHMPSLVVAPTGAGKTGIVALLPYVLVSQKALVLSPSRKITEQLEKAFGLRNDNVKESFVYQRGFFKDTDTLKNFLEKGKVMHDTENVQNMDVWNLVIVNAQKFGANSNASLVENESTSDEVRKQIHAIRKNFEKFSTLIVDEAHHYPATTWDLIIEEFRGKQIIFLTATPFRGSDRRELLPGMKVTYSISKKTLIDLDIIRKLEYKDLSCECNEYEKIRDEILEILKYHDEIEPTVKHKAMVLTSDTAHAEDAARQMGNIASYHTSEKRTNTYLENFEKSKSKILLVCGKLLEGYDNSDVSICVILRKVGVLGLFTQFVGRCVRVSKNLPDNRKDPVNAVILSHTKYKQLSLFQDYMKDS